MIYACRLHVGKGGGMEVEGKVTRSVGWRPVGEGKLEM